MATTAVDDVLTTHQVFRPAMPGFATGRRIAGPLLSDQTESMAYLGLRTGGMRFELKGGESGCEPRWFYPTLAALQQLLELAPGWDSFEAEPIADLAVIGAVQTLVDLDLPFQAPAPSVVPGSAGSLQLEWHRSGADIEIYISPDADVSVFLSDSDMDFEFEGLSADAIVRLGSVFDRMVS